jgi:hypothetical protein
LQQFYGTFSRWPTNFEDLRTFATQAKLPLDTNAYADAVFTTEPGGRLSVTYGSGSGHIGISRGGPVPIRPQNDFFEQMRSNSAASLAASRLRSNARSDETFTFSFILNNFRDEYGYWPTNTAPVLAFAKKNKQPAVPEGFLDATFTVLSNGGLQIISKSNGTLTIGGSPSAGPGPPPNSSMNRTISISSPNGSPTLVTKQSGVAGYDSFRLQSSVSMFHSFSRAWPTNLAQLTEFLEARHMQPVPELYASAVFSNTPLGGLVIISTNETLSFGPGSLLKNRGF